MSWKKRVFTSFGIILFFTLIFGIMGIITYVENQNNELDKKIRTARIQIHDNNLSINQVIQNIEWDIYNTNQLIIINNELLKDSKMTPFQKINLYKDEYLPLINKLKNYKDLQIEKEKTLLSNLEKAVKTQKQQNKNFMYFIILIFILCTIISTYSYMRVPPYCTCKS